MFLEHVSTPTVLYPNDVEYRRAYNTGEEFSFHTKPYDVEGKEELPEGYDKGARVGKYWILGKKNYIIIKRIRLIRENTYLVLAKKSNSKVIYETSQPNYQLVVKASNREEAYDIATENYDKFRHIRSLDEEEIHWRRDFEREHMLQGMFS